MKKINIIVNDIDKKLYSIIFNEIKNKLNINFKEEFIEKETNIDEIIYNVREKNVDGYYIDTLYRKELYENLSKEYCSEKTKMLGYSNVLINNNNEVIAHNLDYNAIIEMIVKYDLDLQNKNIVIIGHNLLSKAVIQVLKDFKANIFVLINSGIPNDIITKAKFVNKLEFKKLNDIYMVINTTDIGKMPDINTEVIIDIDTIKTKWAIDLIYTPKETVFLLKEKLAGANTASGLYMYIVKVLKFIALLYDDPKLYKYNLLNELYEIVKKKLGDYYI